MNCLVCNGKATLELKIKPDYSEFYCSVYCLIDNYISKYLSVLDRNKATSSIKINNKELEELNVALKSKGFKLKRIDSIDERLFCVEEVV